MRGGWLREKWLGTKEVCVCQVKRTRAGSAREKGALAAGVTLAAVRGADGDEGGRTRSEQTNKQRQTDE